MLAKILRTYASAFRGMPRGVWILSVTAMIHRAGTMVLPFLALFLTQDRGLSETKAAGIVAIYGLGSILGSQLGGKMSDRYGARFTLLFSLIGTGFAYASLVFLEDVRWFAAGVFVASTVAEIFRPALMVAIAELSPPAGQARAYALMRLMVNAGMSVGPAVAGMLAVYDYDLLFFADALTSWGAAVWLALSLKQGLGAREREPHEIKSGPSPWRDGPYLALLGLVFLLALVLFQLFSTWPLYLTEAYGLREDMIGWLFAFNAVLIVLFEMVITQWADRRDPMRFVAVGALFLCAGFAVLAVGQTLAWALLTVALWSVGEMLILPLTNALVARHVDPRWRGNFMGLYVGAFALAFVLAPIIGGSVYERFGPDVLWISIGVLGPLTALWALAIRRHYPGPEEEPPPADR